MDFKKEIDKKGLKLVWLAKQINCNYSSLRVYLANENLMPEWVSNKLKDILK